MCKLKNHALNEFKSAGWVDRNGKYKDKAQKKMCNHILKLLDIFEKENHSGSSAAYAIDLFCRLAKFESITPLNLEDKNEWENASSDLLQNKRNSAVFKDSEGVFYLNAVIFNHKGVLFTSSGIQYSGGLLRSSLYVSNTKTFTPKPFIIDVITGGDGEYIIKDESKLKDVFEIYESK